MEKEMRFFLLILIFFISCDQNPIGKARKDRKQKLIAYSVTNISTNSAQVNWSCSESSTGILSYGKNTLDTSLTSIKNATIHSMNLTNLNQNQTYYYKTLCDFPSNADISILVSPSFQTNIIPDPVPLPPPVQPEPPAPPIIPTPTPPPPPLLSSEQIKRGIWILGGSDNSGNAIAQVDFFDPVLNKWYANVTNIPTPRKFAGIVSNNGKIYVMGGMVGSSTVSTVEELTPGDTFVWRTMNPMPVTLQGFVVSSTTNEIYIIGGSTTNIMQIGTLPAFSLYRFQPLIGSLGIWATITTATALMPNVDLSGCIIDGTFIFGGGRYYNDGSAQNTVNGYVTGSNTTTTINEASFTYSAHGTASVCYRPIPSDPYPSDTKSMLVTGGSTITDLNQPVNSVAPSNQYNYYQPLTNTMSVGPVLPVALYYPSAEISYDNRRLYLFGGASAINIPTNTVYSIPLTNPISGPWQIESTMPLARFAHKAVILSR
jgi:hypothetical protein